MSDRRHFLKMLSTAAVGLAAEPIIIACGGGAGGQSEAKGSIPAGNVSEVTKGDPVVLDQPVVVVLDSNGLYAMSTICTHQQCDMRNDGNISRSGLDCYCHGSMFSINGAVEQGPAARPLRHYAVEIDMDGNITVQADQVVAASERTPLPG